MSEEKRQGWMTSAEKEESPSPEVEDKQPEGTEEVQDIKEVTDPGQMSSMIQEKMRHTCPRCQWDIREGAPRLADADLEEYLRCLVANRSFEKDISIYGGKLVIRCREGMDKVTEEVMRLLTTVKGDNFMDNMTIGRKIQTLFTVIRMTVEGEEPKEFEIPKIKEFETYKDALEEFTKRFGGATETRQSILFKAITTFQTLVTAASEGAFDENFYQGAGLVWRSAPTQQEPLTSET